jgi:putative transposase
MESRAYSQRKACMLVNLNRATFRRKPKLSSTNQQVCSLLLKLAHNHKRWGFDLMFRWMKHNGYNWNHKRVYKIYCYLGLNLRIKPKKRLPNRQGNCTKTN